MTETKLSAATPETPKRILVGHVFAVPLGDDRWGYIEYAKKRAAFLNTAIWLYDWFSPKIANLDELDTHGRPFTLMLSHFQGAVKEGRWKYVGRHDHQEFEAPLFVGANGDLTRGVSCWFVSNEYGDIKLGETLSDEYRRLEPDVSFLPEDVELRLQGKPWLPEYENIAYSILDLPTPDSPAPWIAETGLFPPRQ